jgi:hypothetical protein
MTRDQILRLARKHDAGACWASDDANENCLLVLPSATVFLLDRVTDAYEDPNPAGSVGEHTRVVFPSIPA